MKDLLLSVFSVCLTIGFALAACFFTHEKNPLQLIMFFLVVGIAVDVKAKR